MATEAVTDVKFTQNTTHFEDQIRKIVNTA